MAKNYDVPEGFKEMAEGRSLEELSTGYCVGIQVIRRWLKEAGISSKKSSKIKIPDDFVEFAAEHTLDECSARYGVGKSTLARWKKETGATTVPAYKTGRTPHLQKVRPGYCAEKEAIARKKGKTYADLQKEDTLKHRRFDGEEAMKWLRSK